ncbi:Uncharacterised protein [Mycobacteroides abscessus subsp. abscessus]|uniref:hypothetical protein n=1 Tax=Mycobacteroides abscessus TaxID=36809 RepID=UPI0009A6B1FF|nr:hypothetical protein [Mycobacteroides abscessus]SKV12224.1 Uncharacterised protein [Mycobacteroides abscessus subsp. abscessus]
MTGLDRVRRFALDGDIRDLMRDTGCSEDDAWTVVSARDPDSPDDPVYDARVRDLLRGRVPAAVVHALSRGTEPVADVLDAVDTYRELNADGGFPAALVCAGLGVPDDTLTDEQWNAWCGGSDE